MWSLVVDCLWFPAISCVILGKLLNCALVSSSVKFNITYFIQLLSGLICKTFRSVSGVPWFYIKYMLVNIRIVSMWIQGHSSLLLHRKHDGIVYPSLHQHSTFLMHDTCLNSFSAFGCMNCSLLQISVSWNLLGGLQSRGFNESGGKRILGLRLQSCTNDFMRNYTVNEKKSTFL
jgi:hypothetical protein